MWIIITVGLWRRRERHTVGCSGALSGRQISSRDDRSQQIQVSVPEAEHWCQRQTGCWLSEPSHFSQLHCKLAQVTWCYFVTRGILRTCTSPNTSILPPCRLILVKPNILSCQTFCIERNNLKKKSEEHPNKCQINAKAVSLICDHNSHHAHMTRQGLATCDLY